MDIKLRQPLSIIKRELNEYAQCNPPTLEGTWEYVQQFCVCLTWIACCWQYEFKCDFCKATVY